MANVTFVDTTKTSVGSGTFQDPYNYLPKAILTSGNKIYIASDSILEPFEVTLTSLTDPLIIRGYDASAEIDYWGDENESAKTSGPVIYANNKNVCITFKTTLSNIPASDSDPILCKLECIRMYGYAVEPFSVEPPVDFFNIQVTDCETVAPAQYLKAWRRVRINVPH